MKKEIFRFLLINLALSFSLSIQAEEGSGGADVEGLQIAAEKAALDSLRGASPDTTEYTFGPSAVEMVVELDPVGHGFRQRNHRMQLAIDGDLLVRGRGALSFEYRFFEHFAVGIRGGVDSTKVSLYNNLRESFGRPAPEQFSILGGAFAKWRLTEWYLHSAIFLEPSLLVGRMWQTLAGTTSNHYLLRPGVFFGLESVFDSGLALSCRTGVEFPFDFGPVDRTDEVAVPLFLLGIGFAI